MKLKVIQKKDEHLGVSGLGEILKSVEIDQALWVFSRCQRIHKSHRDKSVNKLFPNRLRCPERDNIAFAFV